MRGGCGCRYLGVRVGATVDVRDEQETERQSVVVYCLDRWGVGD